MKPSSDHIVFVYTKPEHFECQHCHETESVPLPMGVSELGVRADGFIRRHASCPKPVASGLVVLCGMPDFPIGSCDLPSGHHGKHGRTKLNGERHAFE